MKQIKKVINKQILKDCIILQKYPNYVFNRATKELFRTNFGDYIKIKKDSSGRLRVKKKGESHYFCENELMKATDYGAKGGIV